MIHYSSANPFRAIERNKAQDSRDGYFMFMNVAFDLMKPTADGNCGKAKRLRVHSGAARS